MKLKTLIDAYNAMKMIGTTHCMAKANLETDQMLMFYNAFYALQSALHPHLQTEVALDDDEQYEIDNLKRTDMAVYQSIRDMKVKHESL